MIYFGLNRQSLLEKAKMEGRNEAISEINAGKMPGKEASNKQRSFSKPLPLPHTESNKPNVDPAPKSDQEKEMQFLVQSFRSADGSNLLGDF